MGYKIVVTKNAQKNIKKLSPQVQKRIKQKLLFFIGRPDPLGTAKQLKDGADGQYRWRIGVHRVVFDVDKQIIVILRVQHRRDVYRKK